MGNIRLSSASGYIHKWIIFLDKMQVVLKGFEVKHYAELSVDEYSGIILYVCLNLWQGRRPRGSWQLIFWYLTVIRTHTLLVCTFLTYIRGFCRAKFLLNYMERKCKHATVVWSMEEFCCLDFSTSAPKTFYCVCCKHRWATWHQFLIYQQFGWMICVFSML